MVDFKGFEEYAEKIDKMTGKLKPVMEKALIESKKLVTPGIHDAMKKHRLTGETEESINEEMKVDWTGTVGSIEIGFDLKRGGMPSIYLMYGTPRMQKDVKLYNSIYGSATKKKIRELQQKIFEEALEG